jgi:hypothetical protein
MNQLPNNKVLIIGGAIIVLIIGISIGLSISKDGKKVSDSNDSNVNILEVDSSNIKEGIAQNKNVNVNESQVVITPDGSFDIVSEIPNLTNSDKISLDIRVTSSNNAETIDAFIGGNLEASMLLEDDGIVTIPIILNPGDNLIQFKLGNTGIYSEFYRTAEINYDNVPPRIDTFGCSKTGLTSTLLKNLKNNEEYLCIATGQFSGPLVGTAQAPLYGSVSGDFEIITYDGKTVHPEEDGFINQRISVYVRAGTNIFDIIAIDKAGNESKKRDTVEWEKEGDQIDLNIE